MKNSPTLFKPKPGFWWVVGAIVLAAGVVILGAFTRLVDAGLGCPDWPGCYGHLLWPDNASEIAAANRAFPDTPVIQGKPWPEMVHRYFAGTLAICIAGLAIMAMRFRKLSGYPFRLPLLLVVLVIWQALFGMWTVTLKLWPQIVTLHLLGGFTIFSLLTVLAQRLHNYYWRPEPSQFLALKAVRPWLILSIIAIVLQIALGGWVASNYAAFGCVDFPKCNESWWPTMNVAQGFNIFQSVGPNYLGGLMESSARTAIHFSHRLGAIITSIIVILSMIKVMRAGYRPASILAGLVFILLILQVLLGISNVLMHISLWVAVVHNFVGVVLLSSAVAVLVQQIRMREVGQE